MTRRPLVNLHWKWFSERCSTLKADPRYTSNTVFDSFPWPQKPSAGAVAKVAKVAVDLRELRRKLRDEHDLTLRELYRLLEPPGAHPLKDVQGMLDQAVREAYGMPKSADPLAFLLKLNAEMAAKEEAGEPVLGPGLPPTIKDRSKYVTTDCLRMP